MSAINSMENVSDPHVHNGLCKTTADCFRTTPGGYIVTVYTITSIVFLLPLYIYILHLGFKQIFSPAVISHCDHFTYHMLLVELLNVSACTCVCCGVYTNEKCLIWVGDVIFHVSQSGQLFFHTITCLERYLAVVHPVAYLRLKEEKWIKARNFALAFFWLFYALMLFSAFDHEYKNYILLYIITFLELVLILQFSVCVIRVLVSSGPWEGNKKRPQVDQSKLKALYLIAIVMLVLLFRLSMEAIIGLLLFLSKDQYSESFCVLLSFTYWMGLPSSLTLPILYLKRNEKLIWKK